MKHIKTILVLASLLVFGQGAWALHFVKNTGVEEGTESYPFLIETVEDLQNLAKDVNSGESYHGIYFKLMQDLSFGTEYSYTPIGYVDESGGKAFMGIFDGDNHTIGNITYNAPDSEGVGLFGYIHYPAVIKNVSLDYCSFTGNNSVGAIVGSSAGGGPNEWGVFNCTAGATVEVTATKATIENEECPGTYAGGIIGYSHCLTVSNCYSEATVKGDEFVGSIAGYMLGSTAHEAIIQECYFTGSVKAVGGRGKDDGFDEKATNGIINITLYDKDDKDINNAQRLSNYNGETVNVALSGRTLYKDNKWNTLCLPFAINDFTTETPLKDATVMKLSSSSFGDGTLELDFESLTKLEAGQPCLVKWASGENISNPIFQDVKINNTTNDAQTTYSDFKGNFSTVGLASWNMSVLYLGADNKLYTPSKENFTIGAFRAYFQLKGVNAPAPYSEARASRFVMNFSGGEITSVNEVLRMKNEVPADAWYDLQGRKLNGKPNQKGIYINNGKRIVIK